MGDTAVATCISCHGAHGILSVKDSRAPVFPTHIAETCNRCHGDATLMGDAQTALRRLREVHAERALRGADKKGDLSSPTCNSCHGNHGAAPPRGRVRRQRLRHLPHDLRRAIQGEPARQGHSPTWACRAASRATRTTRSLHPVDAFLSTGNEGKCGDVPRARDRGREGRRRDVQGHHGPQDGDDSGQGGPLAARPRPGMFVATAQFELSRADEALTKARADVHLFRSTTCSRPSRPA